MRPNNKKNRLITEKLLTFTFPLPASRFLLFSLLAFSFLLLNSCNTTEPGRQPGITLNFEDASSTEVWMKLNTNGLDLPAEVSVYKNNKLSKNINLTSKDSVIYQDNLLPNKTYTFRAAVKLGDLELQSKSITAATMDTTSHNFTWQTFTFGGVNGSSILRDVAIINENDIWAVGEIHTAATDQYDSNGVWVQPYNAIHWNGNKWELKKIMFYIDQDQPSSGETSSPCQTCFVFSDSKLAISSNVQTAIFDANGNYQIIKMGFAWKDRFTINSMWGTSSKDFYAVGNNGNIAHYNGSQWTKIESGIETDIKDIWGNTDKITGKKKVLCAVSNVITLGDNKILEIKEDNTISEVSWNTGDIDKRVNSIWFNNNNQIFTCGGGVFISKNDGLWKKQILPSIHTNKIRGNDKNDVFVAGDFGLVAHFNGVSWKVYSEVTNVALFYSLDYKKNILLAVGERNSKAIILKMMKQ